MLTPFFEIPIVQHRKHRPNLSVQMGYFYQTPARTGHFRRAKVYVYATIIAPISVNVNPFYTNLTQF